MLLYLNIIIAIIFILQKSIKIFNDAEEKIIKCNDPPLNLFGIDLNMENTYKLIYFIFFLIIGIVLSFNIIKL